MYGSWRSKAHICTKTRRVKNASGPAASCEFRAARNIGAAATRKRAHFFIRNHLPNSTWFRPSSGRHRLPGAIRRTVGADAACARVNIGDPRLGLPRIHQSVIAGGLPSIRRTGERVLGNGREISGRDEVLERLRRLLFIECVMVDAV